MTGDERRCAEAAVARRRTFLVLSIAGVVIALALGAYYAGCRWQDPAYPLRGRVIVVLLILLNARHNLRHYRFATLMEQLLPGGSGSSR